MVVDTLGNAKIQQSAAKIVKHIFFVANSHLLFTVALETLGPTCIIGLEFMLYIARKMSETANDSRETSFVFQILPVVVQKFN